MPASAVLLRLLIPFLKAFRPDQLPVGECHVAKLCRMSANSSCFPRALIGCLQTIWSTHLLARPWPLCTARWPSPGCQRQLQPARH